MAAKGSKPPPTPTPSEGISVKKAAKKVLAGQAKPGGKAAKPKPTPKPSGGVRRKKAK